MNVTRYSSAVSQYINELVTRNKDTWTKKHVNFSECFMSILVKVYFVSVLARLKVKGKKVNG
jgi:hypothetical protein